MVVQIERRVLAPKALRLPAAISARSHGDIRHRLPQTQSSRANGPHPQLLAFFFLFALMASRLLSSRVGMRSRMCDVSLMSVPVLSRAASLRCAPATEARLAARSPVQSVSVRRGCVSRDGALGMSLFGHTMGMMVVAGEDGG